MCLLQFLRTKAGRSANFLVVGGFAYYVKSFRCLPLKQMWKKRQRRGGKKKLLNANIAQRCPVPRRSCVCVSCMKIYSRLKHNIETFPSPPPKPPSCISVGIIIFRVTSKQSPFENSIKLWVSFGLACLLANSKWQERKRFLSVERSFLQRNNICIRIVCWRHILPHAFMHHLHRF